MTNGLPPRVKEREEHQRQLRELGNDPKALLAWSIENSVNISSADEDELGTGTEEIDSSFIEKPSCRSFPVVRFGISPRDEVGRNDPCPCGSGKKFKKVLFEETVGKCRSIRLQSRNWASFTMLCQLCESEEAYNFHHFIPRTLHSNKWFKSRYSKQEMQKWESTSARLATEQSTT